jgi:hypothetical protein
MLTTASTVTAPFLKYATEILAYVFPRPADAVYPMLISISRTLNSLHMAQAWEKSVDFLDPLEET